MISTVMRIAWLNLRRDRVAQAMTFLLPIVFFSIFALVFGDQGRANTRPLRVAVVDEDASEASRAFVSALGQGGRAAARRDARGRGRRRRAPPRVPLDRARAEALVRDGDVPVALVLPAGFGAGSGASSRRRAPQLLADPSDPIAGPLVQGLLQKTAATAAQGSRAPGAARCSRSTPAA